MNSDRRLWQRYSALSLLGLLLGAGALMASACGGANKPGASSTPLQNTATEQDASGGPEAALLTKLDSLAFAVNVDCLRLTASIDRWLDESGDDYDALAARVAAVERPGEEADALEGEIVERLKGIVDRIDSCAETDGVKEAAARLTAAIGS